MRGFNNEAWVTSVLNDDEVAKALTLATGLKLSCTNRWLSVVVSSTKTSAKSRDLLVDTFDFVFPLEEERNKGHLKMEDFAKICAIRSARSFRKCVYVAPGMMPVKNCDEIFDLGKSGSEDSGSENFYFLENMDPSIFVFKPSKELGTALMEGLANYRNGVKNANFLKMWIQNNSSGLETRFVIPMKFNRTLELEDDLEEIGNDSEIFMVNWSSLNPREMEDSKQEKMSMAMKLAVNHWKNIQTDINLGAKGHSQNTDHWKKEPIAIVGMSCRYPNANNLEEFWNLLLDGGDGTGQPPEFRWLPDQSVMSSTISASEFRKTNAGFLKVPVDEFDAKFFGISPKEMVSMDPQHRLLHEIIWESLEDAAIDPNSLKGSLGAVYLGSWLNDYKDILINSGNAEFYRGYMGNSIGAMAARISHFLGLTGPSIATESGCSSAMVALHLACNSLQKGETNLAVAGGVNLLLRPFTADMMPMVISPDGHCKTFDESANGFARAEGCGVMVLKRLSDAVKDGDRIWALIRGTGVSQEGTSKSMGTPTVHSESLAMEQALEDANVRPEEISYVEAHGTGTVVGDPLEVAAISKVYHSKRRSEPLVIGSVKANVGHTESCSGITGIMKVVLSMVHETIPPQRNLTKLNPNINLESVPAKIPLTALEWRKSEDRPRLAGVSSFGITGTDAHAIIEECPDVSGPFSHDELMQIKERNLQILKISAKTSQALEVLVSKYEEFFQNVDDENPSLEDICHTANIGRANFPHRAIILGKSKAEMLSSIHTRRYLQGVSEESSKKICFLFTGQGSQYPGMARNLYETSPVFKMHFDYCFKILQKNYGVHIKDVLWSSSDSGSSEISRTIYSQTSIFCVEYALLKLWESLGVTPDLVLGHSLGEFAAAVAAGILSVADALKLVAERSLLIDKLPTGKMLVIKADHSTVSSHMFKFGKALDFAAVNSAEQTVVAGDSSTILEFAEYLKTEQNLKCLVLEATHAFHSRHMDSMLDAYREVALSLKKCPKKMNPKCVYVSGLRGKVIDSMDEVIDPQYWVDHTREKVMFLEASKAVAVDCDLFIEIGPQPILSAMTMMNNEDKSLSCLPSLKKNSSSDWEVILGSLGKLYLEGFNKINWQGLDMWSSRSKRRKVRLPHYPFIGSKFWPEMNASGTGVTLHPLIGCSISNPTSTKLFQVGLSLKSSEFDYIKDHVIGDHCIFPGAGYLEMCLAAGISGTFSGALEASRTSINLSMKVENLMIEAPLELLEDKTKQLHTVVEPDVETSGTGNSVVKIFQKTDESSWLSHARAIFSPVATMEDKTVHELTPEGFQSLRGQSSGDIEGDAEAINQIYDKLASLGLKFGPSFRSLERIWKSESNILAKVKVQAQPEGHREKYIVHPVVIDAMIQTIMMLRLSSNLKKKLYVPIKIGKFVWLAKSDISMTSDLYIFACGPNNPSHDLSSTEKCTAVLVNSEGHPLAIMSKVEFIDTTVKAVESVLEHQQNSMPELWEEVWRPQLGTIQHRIDLDLCNQRNSENFEVTIEKPEDALEIKIFNNLEQFSYLNMLGALYDLGWSPKLGATFGEVKLSQELGIHENFQKLFSHYLQVLEMEDIIEKLSDGRHGDDGDCWKVTNVPLSKLEVESKLSSSVFQNDLVKNYEVTLLYAEVGRRLKDILRGDQSPLDILFPDEASNRKHPSAMQFYQTYLPTFRLETEVGDALGSWLKSLCEFKSKNCSGTGKFILRVLEVGAGTGSSTERILAQLRKYDIEFEYVFTDISGAFFAAAEKKFKDVKNMTFRKLNIEDDPVSQGFIPEYFDLILAWEVLHATRNIQRSLANVSTLLRPGGRLDLFEQTKVSRSITYIFGLLDGFWHFEDNDLRKGYCMLSGDMWDQAFKNSGFEIVKSTKMLMGYHSYISARKCHSVTFDTKRTSSEKIWILYHFQDDLGVSRFLRDKITSLPGRRVVLVTPDTKLDVDLKERSEFKLRPRVEQDFTDMMTHLGTGCKKNGSSVEGIIYSWSLDPKVIEQDDLLRPYMYVVKSMYKAGGNPRLITLTRGATNPTTDCDLRNIHSSTILGFTKSFRNERSEFMGKCLDICETGRVDVHQQIFYEIWKNDKEAQLSFHGGTSYVPKLVSLKPRKNDVSLPPGNSDRYQLILPESRSISDLEFGPLEFGTSLDSDEVEIQVKAVALNFKDVLTVLKPTEVFQKEKVVGIDYSGVISRVGDGVTKWVKGQRVFGMDYKAVAMRSYTRQCQDDIIAVPEVMTFCEAATLPAVFSTAYHCLIDVAQMTSNDIVLIHTASGGVGLSAIQICRNVGATIICTVGSSRKKNFLRGLGVQHIFHSRNTEYLQRIMEVTKGHGVDIVLNSLTSEGFKEATLKSCAEGARFIEMSKLNVWTPQEVHDLRPDVFYKIVDLSSMAPPEARRLLRTMAPLLEQGTMKPIPYVRFDAVQIRDALNFLSKAKHIGKIVCVLPEVRSPGVTGGGSKTEVITPLFNKESTYLITGGLGGIGFTVCKWMVQKHDARWVILAGRRSPDSKMFQEIEELNTANGSKVTCVQLDVSCYQQCSDLLVSKIPELGAPPLRGIMHCAGTLHDGLVDNQDWPGFSSTFPTKIRGTLNLHELTMTLNLRLEHFVVFSSFTAMFGSPGQANHTAGNLFEDTLAHYRHTIGLPATTVNWGQWSEVGVATEVEIPGVNPISNAHALKGLEYCMRSPQRVQTSVINIESFVVLNKLSRHVQNYLDEEVWRSSMKGAPGSGNGAMKSEDFWHQYDSLGSERSEKENFLSGQLKNMLRNILKLEDSEVIEDDANFQEMGVDSLMFVELKNSLQTLFSDRVTVNASAVRDCDTVRKLTSKLVAMIEGDDISSQDSVAPSMEEVAALIREDAQLPKNIRAKEGSKTVDVSDIKVVMVTGVTGTLGPYILKELTTGCVSDQVTKVICLVRDHRSLSGEDRLKKALKNRDLSHEVDMSKVKVISGNIALPHLGLDEATWSELIDEVDAVFHCAALVQHIEYYRKSAKDTKSDMRAVNIGGTKNILEFCTSGATKLKSLFHCSTMFTLTTVDQETQTLNENWPKIGDFDGITSVAYPITKFVGDILVKEAVQERGIPAKVLRFPLIFGDSRSGRFVLENNHAMLRYLFIMKTGVMPSNPFPMILLPVDKCASIAVKIFFDERCPFGEIFNLFHDKPRLDQEFVEVARDLGFPVEVVEFQEFAKKVTESTQEDSPFSIFKELYRDESNMMTGYTAPVARHWTEMGQELSQSFFKSAKIAKVAPEFYEGLEPANSYIQRDLRFARDAGWFKRYGLE